MKNHIHIIIMTKRLAITAITMFAILMGISAVAPVMADKDTAPGHNKIDICHFDDEENQYVLISIPEKAAKAHEKNHDMDIIPAPEDGCPVIEPEPIDTDGDGLTDDEERILGTDPLLADTDSDGLSDGEEVNTYLTDPLNSDTDNGGVSDGQEVNVDGTDPLVGSDDMVIISP
jgi:hypothetical protein